MDVLKVFTAFSGYDSQCMALDRIGIDYDLVGWSEIDKYAIIAHNAVYPQYKDHNFGDIRKIDWYKAPDFDLFTYSSPCQDFSQAGLQAGGAKGSGTRSSLLWECERAIEIKRPKYLVFENVAGLVSGSSIKTFNEWQLTLERLGYTNFTQVLNAKLHGYPTPIPQNRDRVFMVSILNCDKAFYFPDETPLQYRLVDYLEHDVEDRYYLKEARIKHLMESTEKQKWKENKYAFCPTDGSGVAATITAKSGERKTDNFILEPIVLCDLQEENKWQGKVVRQQNKVISTDGVSLAITSGHTDHAFKIAEPMVLGWTRDALGNIVDRHPVDIANAVTAMKRDNTQNYVVEPINTQDGCCRTIKAQYTFTSIANLTRQDSLGATGVTDGVRIRKLTPRECFRLMGVSEGDIDKIQSAGISRTRQTRLAGNSIVVNCLAAIFYQMYVGNRNRVQQLTIF